jgi:hypothetical protein
MLFYLTDLIVCDLLHITSVDYGAIRYAVFPSALLLPSKQLRYLTETRSFIVKKAYQLVQRICFES